jgi:WD40-like Beta Propeller Repeat
MWRVPLSVAALAGAAPAGAAGLTERVSVASGGQQANYDSSYSAIAADGRHVAFTSGANNLVAGDTNGVEDVFVHDRQTGTTERVSVVTGGGQANGAALDQAAISADGRYVAFASWASNLAAGDTNGTLDVFVHDRQTATTELISVATGGEQANDGSYQPGISADGRHVTFTSFASNLIPGDTNEVTDVFVRDRAGAPDVACSDGSDSDGDGATDYPADPGCNSLTDNNETNQQCNDGLDNDGDGVADHPSDPGCSSRTDNNETNPQCNDGLDNDGDGFTDHPSDRCCRSPTDNNETDPAAAIR